MVPSIAKSAAIEVLEAMKNHPHYKAPLGGSNSRTWAWAIGYWFNVGLPSSCTLSVNADGTVNLVEGSHRQSAGLGRSISMQAAEVLGIAAGRRASDGGGYGIPSALQAVTGGSRTTFCDWLGGGTKRRRMWFGR